MSRMGSRPERVRLVTSPDDPRRHSATPIRKVEYNQLNRDEYHRATRVEIVDC